MDKGMNKRMWSDMHFCEGTKNTQGVSIKETQTGWTLLLPGISLTVTHCPFCGERLNPLQGLLTVGHALTALARTPAVLEFDTLEDEIRKIVNAEIEDDRLRDACIYLLGVQIRAIAHYMEMFEISKRDRQARQTS